MKVGITGGSGVVGAAIVRHLVDSGHEVRALARSEDAGSVVAGLGAIAVAGSLDDYPSLLDLATGSDVVFHVAGMNAVCVRYPETMWAVNVEGTRQVLRACLESGVRRVVHTSSAVTLGEEPGGIGSETTVHRGTYLSEYERTKTEAERIALHESDGLEVVVVNPSSVQGPGRSSGTGRLIAAAARGGLPFLVDTIVSIVDIDDCARGHLLAAERGIPGERYILSGASLDLREAMRLLESLTGVRSPRFVKPWVIKALGAVSEVFGGALGRETPLCRESVRVLLNGHRYDGSRATRALGLEYTPLEETLRRTISWMREGGLL